MREAFHHLRVRRGGPADGRQEGRPQGPFDRTKIRIGITKACEKRPISTDAIETMVDSVERACQEFQDKEIPSSAIGEKVMRELQNVDGVAYVRFASVYRSSGMSVNFLTN
jgi:transcriptional repressor NrdR